MNLPFDVSRCTGRGCKHKHQCKRYLAIATDRMDVTRTVPMTNPPQGECGMMIPVEEQKQ